MTNSIENATKEPRSGNNKMVTSNSLPKLRDNPINKFNLLKTILKTNLTFN